MSEVCNKLATIDLPCLSQESRLYFRDVLDNLMRIEAGSNGLMDVIRAAFEASNLVEQQRQSEITRQLAAWAGILGVPTAMAGIYGMNFANLPGTGSQWGYLAVLGAMGSACGLLYWRFRSLGWLQPRRLQRIMRKRCTEFVRKISFLAVELRAPGARTMVDDDAMRATRRPVGPRCRVVQMWVRACVVGRRS